MEKLKLNTPLNIDEIDFRVQSVNKGGYATILAYKDARVDMKRLDDVYGAEFWQKKYDLIDNHLFCSVGIFNKEINQWIWKQDVGTESMAEKEKGEASDAFKRACFNLGIGRELYDYPMIQVKLNDSEFDKATGKPTFNFKLKEWVWQSEFKDGKLILLIAKDNNGIVRFNFSKTIQPTVDEVNAKIINAKTLAELQTLFLALPVNEQKLAFALKEKLKAVLK
jgi:hypothetical protein